MDNEKIGRQIAILRKEKGLTAEKLAELISVSPQAVSKWENGKNLPETATLPLLAQILNCSIDTVLIPKELQILSAVYTDGETMIDVTRFLNGLINNNRLNIIFNKQLVNIHIESSRLKILTVKYQIPNGVYGIYVTENSELNLDIHSAHEKLNMSFKIMGAYYGNEADYADAMVKMKHYQYFKWNEIPANHETFPSSTGSNEIEFLTVIYSSEDQIQVISCREGESLCLAQNKTKFILREKTNNSYYLKDIMKLNWKQGMDCTWAGALYAVMKYLGENLTYEYLMGVSGACYRLAFTTVWDYSSVDALVAFDYADIAFKALGYEHWWADRIDKSERDAERRKIMEDLRGGKPLLAINLRIAPEWGIITGFLDNGKRLLCRTYFDQDIFDQYKDIPDYFEEHGGYLETDFWPFAIEHIGKKVEKPTEKVNLINSLKAMIESWEAKQNRNYYQGQEAYEKWIERLSDEEWFKSATNEELTRALSVNDYQLINLIDARRCAAVYLKNSIGLLDSQQQKLLKEIVEIHYDISSRLTDFYNKLQSVNDNKLEYNLIKSVGNETEELRKEQNRLLTEIKSKEQSAIKIAKELL